MENETTEQKANKLGFKIGDYCLETKLNEYVGKIESFVFKDSILTAKCEMKNSFSYHYLCELTNKIIIHTPTQEIFDFVCHKTGQTHTFDNTVYGVTLNEKELIIDTTSYLALKFKEYLIICNCYKEYHPTYMYFLFVLLLNKKKVLNRELPLPFF